MSTKERWQFDFNPKFDERQIEESALVELVSKTLPFSPLAVVIACEPPGHPERRVNFSFACWPWQYRAASLALKPVAYQVLAHVQRDARVAITRMPIHVFFMMRLLQWLEKRKARRASNR